MEIIEISVDKAEFESLEPHGTVWIRTGKKVVAIEIKDGLTLNFIYRPS